MGSYDNLGKIKVICSRCGVTDTRFDCYTLHYKLSGFADYTKHDFCSSCWSECGLQEMVEKIKEAVNGD